MRRTSSTPNPPSLRTPVVTMLWAVVRLLETSTTATMKSAATREVDTVVAAEAEMTVVMMVIRAVVVAVASSTIEEVVNVVIMETNLDTETMAPAASTWAVTMGKMAAWMTATSATRRRHPSASTSTMTTLPSSIVRDSASRGRPPSWRRTTTSYSCSNNSNSCSSNSTTRQTPWRQPVAALSNRSETDRSSATMTSFEQDKAYKVEARGATRLC